MRKAKFIVYLLFYLFFVAFGIGALVFGRSGRELFAGVLNLLWALPALIYHIVKKGDWGRPHGHWNCPNCGYEVDADRDKCPRCYGEILRGSFFRKYPEDS